jgi:alkylation response protein AidB-like acyl-CoA dehydrogenase
VRYLSYIFGQNHWEMEPDLEAVVRRYWPGMADARDELSAFGALVGTEALEAGYHADHEAPPRLVAHDVGGKRIDRARLSPDEARLLPKLAAMNRPPYEGGSWHHHFVLGFLLADPGLYCPLIITNQTAYVIHKYAPELRGQWLERLLSGRAWGATWMTETQGGSDLGTNTTTAEREGGLWRLRGEKYFCSGVGLADLAAVTARPAGAPAGPKGLALFLVPRLDAAGELNFKCRRLKDKSATRAVPTGEVVFEGSEAHLVGEAESGIYYTLETLTVSRLANAAGTLGVARKAHLESLLRARQRRAFGRPIIDHPLLRRDLLEQRLRIAAGTALAFHAVEAFERAWHERPPYGPAYHYARLLSHLSKNRTADHSAAVTLSAMEVFAGLGFLEE